MEKWWLFRDESGIYLHTKKVHCYVIEADLLGLISEAGVFVLEIQHLSSIIYCIVRTISINKPVT